MIITYKRKEIANITTINKMVSFIKEHNVYKNFLGFKKCYEEPILDKILSTGNLNFKSVKPFLREFMGPETNRSLEFWLCRGYSEDEALKRIKTLQSTSAKKVNCQKRLLPSNVEYWIIRGYDLGEAVKKVKDRQSTFSLTKCIEKHGVSKGLEVFNNRQNKWLDSLNKTRLLNGGFNNDSSSVDFFKEKYGVDWIKETLNKVSYTENNKKIIQEITNKTKDIDGLINYIKNNIEYYSMGDLDFIFKSKIIQNFYDETYNNIKNNVPDSLNMVKTKFSNYWYVSGYTFNSNGEYEIGDFLMKNNIKFEHNNNYPSSKYRYDFYLPNENVYIEYFGLIKNIGWQKNEVLSIYLDKMRKKVLFCEEMGYNLIYGEKPKKIINKLKNIIWK